MTTDPVAALIEEYHGKMRLHATYAAKAASLEHKRKSLISRLILEQEGVPVTKAEHIARASEAYLRFLEELEEFDRLARQTHADVEYLRARLDVWRTRSATARVQQQGARR